LLLSMDKQWSGLDVARLSESCRSKSERALTLKLTAGLSGFAIELERAQDPSIAAATRVDWVY
jgi:hypothetical protein